MVYLDWAATSPIVRFPIDTSKQWCNPNAAYAYEERKVLMDCEDRIKAAIGAKGGHVLYFRCATDALEWLHNEGNKCMMAWAHSPYEHDAAMFGIEDEPDELIGVDFYCNQFVNQLTGQIHDIEAVFKRMLQYDHDPFLICDCTAAIHHISLKEAKVCQYADAVVTSGHKYGCPDIAFMWIDDRLFNWLGGSKDVRNQWGLKHGSISVGHVLALAEAVEWACDGDRMWDNELNWGCFVNYLLDELGDAAELIGENKYGTFAINAILLPGINADSLQGYLASNGIYIGVGHSSCSANADYRILTRGYGLTEQEASEVIRVSFGPESSINDVPVLVDGIKEYRDKFC